MMLLRAAFAALLALGALVLATEALPAGRVPRLGYLTPSLTPNPGLHEAFRQGPRDLGYVEGRNVVIEYRDAAGKDGRTPRR